MSYDAIYYKKSEISVFFITISYFKNFQIFTFSKFVSIISKLSVSGW